MQNWKTFLFENHATLPSFGKGIILNISKLTTEASNNWIAPVEVALAAILKLGRLRRNFYFLSQDTCRVQNLVI